MFYQIGDGIREISAENLREDVLTAGYVDCDTLQTLQEKLRFAPSTVDACRTSLRTARTTASRCICAGT